MKILDLLLQIWNQQFIKLQLTFVSVLQSWYCTIQPLGLNTDYNNENSQIGKKYLKYLVWFVISAPGSVGDIFCQLFEYVSSDQSSRELKNCQRIIQINVFSSEIWTSCIYSMKRTTNNCQSFFSRFNSSYYYREPNLCQRGETCVRFSKGN